MTMLEHAVDVVIVSGLVLLAWQALAVRKLFHAAVLFIVFGLLMALAWARLAAPDLVLAELAVGAGLTGALLMRATRVMSDGPRSGQ